MNEHKQKLSGVFAPVVTPFLNDEIRLDFLRYNLQKLKVSCLTGYLALGSNGEFMSLDEKEQLDVLSVFAEEKGDKIIMVGTARESTKHTIEFSNRVAEMGFEYVSVLTPHYFPKRMDAESLKGYYFQIADQVKVPVLIYNAPQFCGGVKIPVEIINDLAQHPNIVGMKDSSSEGPAQFLTALEESKEFFLIAGSSNTFYPTLPLGTVGGILSLANIFPEICCDLYQCFVAGRHSMANELHAKIVELNKTLSGSAGVAGVKAAMNLRGFKGGDPRRPLLPLDALSIERIKLFLEREGI